MRNPAGILESYTSELLAVRDRIRDLIGDAHWQTDGEWKESVLRSLLAERMPAPIRVGRGFAISEQGVSSQLDILLYDSTHPPLFRDGDLVIVATHAVRGIVEVKTRINNFSHLAECLDRLARAASFIRAGAPPEEVFVGLFSYEFGPDSDETATRVAEILSTSAPSRESVVDHVALGADWFVKFWPEVPQDHLPFGSAEVMSESDNWIVYDLKGRSFGYFIHNLLAHLSPRDSQIPFSLLFPADLPDRKDAHAAARSQHQMTEITVMIGNVLHQQRNDLHFLSRWAQSYKEAYRQRDRERTDRMLDALMARSRVSLSAVDVLSSYLSNEAIEQEEVVDLCELLREIMDSRGKVLGDEKVIRPVDLPNNPLEVRCNRSLLSILLENLIDNAIKYGSQREISLRSRNRDLARLVVANDGTPVDENELESIFEPFYRGRAASRSRARGTGLGLSLGRWIADRHGGSLTARHATGRGDGRFLQIILTLPLVRRT